MKLLYITVSLPFGSNEEFFIPEINELLRQGHEVLIVPRSPKGAIANRDAENLYKKSLSLHLLSPLVLILAAIEFLRHPVAAMRVFAQQLKSRNLLILAKNTVVFPKGLWLASVARKWRADHIHAQWGLTTGTMAMVAGQMSGIPWSFTVHRGDIVGNNLLELKAREALFVRVISEDGIVLAAEVCGRPLQGNIVMQHLGVEIPAARRCLYPVHSPPVLLCPASLIKRKGQEYLIEALSILRSRGQDMRLQLAGEGERRWFLESLVVQLGLEDAVEFCGQVPHKELLALYETGKVDVVVLPTLHEGIPVCLMEAMVYGIPVVSTKTGGIPELLRDGAGIMVLPQDPEVLADAIARLIQDPALRALLGIAGRNRIEEHFAVGRTVAEFVACIEATSYPTPGDLRAAFEGGGGKR